MRSIEKTEVDCADNAVFVRAVMRNALRDNEAETQPEAGRQASGNMLMQPRLPPRLCEGVILI